MNVPSAFIMNPSIAEVNDIGMNPNKGFIGTGKADTSYLISPAFLSSQHASIAIWYSSSLSAISINST